MEREKQKRMHKKVLIGGHTKLNLLRAWEFVMVRGFSANKTAQKLGVCASTVSRAIHKQAEQLKRFNDCVKIVKKPDYMEGEKLALKATKLNYLFHLNDPKIINEASANNSAYVVDRIGNQIALAEGKPTEIVNFEENRRILIGIITEREELLNRLRGIKGEIIEEKEGAC